MFFGVPKRKSNGIRDQILVIEPTVNYWIFCACTAGISKLTVSKNLMVFDENRKKEQFLKQQILQAVQGNPPNSFTGRVGAVGQIHLI